MSRCYYNSNTCSSTPCTQICTQPCQATLYNPCSPVCNPCQPVPPQFTHHDYVVFQSESQQPLNAGLVYAFGGGDLELLEDPSSPYNLGLDFVVPTSLSVSSLEVSLDAFIFYTNVNAVTDTYTFQLYSLNVPNTGVAVSGLSYQNLTNIGTATITISETLASGSSVFVYGSAKVNATTVQTLTPGTHLVATVTLTTSGSSSVLIDGSYIGFSATVSVKH